VPSLSGLLRQAREQRCAVAAFNVVDPIGMSAALSAAAALDSPVIIQISARIAQLWQAEAARAAFVQQRRLTGAEAVLHLDHCRDESLARRCLDAGWDSVLFDASRLGFAEAVDRTSQLVAAAELAGAEIEGEFEAIGELDRHPTATAAQCAEFVEATRIACFGADVGTGHGRQVPDEFLDLQRIADLRAALDVPLVLHGSSGLSERAIGLAVQHGIAKVNVSTALKSAYRQVLNRHCAADQAFDLAAAMTEIHVAVGEICRGYLQLLGRVGQCSAV
jgi:fructose-bisphosphate aldolase class II